MDNRTLDKKLKKLTETKYSRPWAILWGRVNRTVEWIESDKEWLMINSDLECSLSLYWIRFLCWRSSRRQWKQLCSLNKNKTVLYLIYLIDQQWNAKTQYKGLGSTSHRIMCNLFLHLFYLHVCSIFCLRVSHIFCVEHSYILWVPRSLVSFALLLVFSSAQRNLC